MATPSSTPASSATDALHSIRAHWGWFVALGIAFIVLGAIALAHVLVATLASVLYVGALMVVAGVVQVIHAFRVQTWGRFFYWLLSGLLYAVAGFFAFYNPLLASAVLTFLLAVALVAAGLLRLWVGWEHRAEKGSGWIIAAGIVTLLVGILIALRWPANSLWVLGLFLAIDLVFQGWTFIAFGLALKKAA